MKKKTGKKKWVKPEKIKFSLDAETIAFALCSAGGSPSGSCSYGVSV
jgi:hypothetical protein